MSARRPPTSHVPPSFTHDSPVAPSLRLLSTGEHPAALPPVLQPRPQPLSEAEVEALIAGVPDVVLVLDGAGIYRRIVAGRASHFARPADELLGRSLHEVMPEVTAARLLAVIHTALRTGQPQEVQYELEIEGRELWFDATVSPTREHTVTWIARDVTERRVTERALHERERELLGIFESAFDGMLVCSPDLRCLQVNARLCELLGRSRRELLSLRYSDLLHEEDLSARPLRLAELYASGRIVTERRLRRADGVVLDAEIGTTMLEDGRILLVMRDITERRQAEATIRSLALTDELTGLYNRRGFISMAEREWQRALRQLRGALLFLFDLDDLKPINDAHGHLAGDAALISAAGVLRATFRGSDVVGRLGGDEFAALIVPGGPTADSETDVRTRLQETEALVRLRTERHLDAANAEARLHGRPFRIGISMGVAYSEVDAAPADSLESLIARADAQLYEEKRAGKRERS